MISAPHDGDDCAPREMDAIVTLLTEGRCAEAVPLALARVSRFPLEGYGWAMLGYGLMQMGQMANALPYMEKAAELLPRDSDVQNNLGNILFDLGRTVEAESCYRRAIALNQGHAEAHNNLGNLLRNLGRMEEAETCYRRAIASQPGLADAYSNLGSALMSLGTADEAEKVLSRAIELAPGTARPLSAALLYIPYRQGDPRFEQLEAVYARRETLPPSDRIWLNFAMGRAMECIGQYDRAFDAYAEGNRLHYQTHPFDEAGDKCFLENSCSYFTADLFGAYASLENTMPVVEEERVPIFIVGMPRSGTTLVEQILSGHPAIFGAGEHSIFKETLRLLGRSTGRDELLKLRELGRTYLDRAWESNPGSRYITDKLPAHYRHLGLIHLMLPNAKIIHCMRDPMDTCFSCYATRFTMGHEYSYDLGSMGRHYLRYQKLMQHWHDVLPPGRILDVRYEDNVADPEREARRMLEYLGLPWDAACLNFHEAGRTVQTASVTQVRQPIYSSSINRWKHFEKHLGVLLGTIHQGLQPLGHGI